MQRPTETAAKDIAGRPTVSSLAVVHVALKQFGLAPFRAFLESYRHHPAGCPHELIVVFKGFTDEHDASGHHALLGDLSYVPLYVDDRGFDLGSYFRAAAAFDRAMYCFLNSRSVILADDWLAKLCEHARRPDVGVAGATASRQSLYSDFVEVYRNREDRAPGWRRWARSSMMNVLRHLYYYPPFPNPHLRTNAFAIRREVLGAVRRWPFKTKRDTAQFENGRRGVTRQLAALGLKSVVVGRDGAAYQEAQWDRSGTFWQGDQENLLIADNQTEQYATASEEERRFLRSRAWGTRGAGDHPASSDPSQSATETALVPAR